MSKSKKQNKKTNPKTEEKADQIIKKADQQSPKKKKKQMAKAKKAIKEELIKIPTPGPGEVVAKLSELTITKQALNKSKAKKSPSESDVEEVKPKEEVNGAPPLAVGPEAKVEEKNDAPDAVKQAKKEKNKLKQKLAKAAVKQKTPESVVGPGRTVFVGNVPSNTKRIQLSKLFTPCGQIVSIRFRTANGKVIFKHKMRKESTALNAYVVFDSIEAATKALELNGTLLKGQHLRVQKPEKLQDISDPKNTIFVGNLKYTATDDKLHQIFSSCGEIEYVRTLQSPDKKGCVGTAFVCFKSPDAVGLALELKGTMLDERPIHVERYAVTKLGAKEKRIAENKALGQPKPKGGKPLEKAAWELKNKNKEGGQKYKGSKKPQGKPTQDNKGQDEKKKKSEFRGVKSGKTIKKTKKKIPSQMKRLANKIAPKD